MPPEDLSAASTPTDKQQKHATEMIATLLSQLYGIVFVTVYIYTSSEVSAAIFLPTSARFCTASITDRAVGSRLGNGLPRVSVKIISWDTYMYGRGSVAIEHRTCY